MFVIHLHFKIYMKHILSSNQTAQIYNVKKLI